MMNILNGILHFLEEICWLDWLNYLLVYSLQATLIAILLWPLRKPLARVTNVQLAVRVLATILSMMTTVMWYQWVELYDLRPLYRLFGASAFPCTSNRKLPRFHP